MRLQFAPRSVRTRRVVGLLVLTFSVTGVVASPPASPAPAFASACSNTSVGYVPLIDGEGLYADGNTMPASHLDAAPDIVEMNGIVGVASLGMSNTVQEWGTFMDEVEGLDFVSSSLEFANGAVSSKPMIAWADPSDNVWGISVGRIEADGLSTDQVQIVWMKMGSQLSDLIGNQDQRIEQERAWLDETIANAKDVFPNLVRIYISSRVYAGYNSSSNHNEPETGFDNGLSVKEVVADSIAGDTAVWTAWGPYLWADGTTPRSDGLTWECSDFLRDGVHPSEKGEEKVTHLLVDFFSTDESACGWFLADPHECDPSPTPGHGHRPPRR